MQWRDPIESWCHQGLLPKLNSVLDQRWAFRLFTPLSVRLLCALVRQRVALYWSWWGQKRNRRSWTQTQSSNLVSPAQFTRSPVSERHTPHCPFICLSVCVCDVNKSLWEIENMWKWQFHQGNAMCNSPVQITVKEAIPSLNAEGWQKAQTWVKEDYNSLLKWRWPRFHRSEDVYHSQWPDSRYLHLRDG